jgi:tripartite-type tricarboxylate transporter receptor subunit TctC
MKQRLFCYALTMLSVFICAESKAKADTVEQFYSNRTLTLRVGFPAGAAYDIYARLLSRHLDRHIPGRPTIVVTNQPGAASLIATNTLANVVPKDGSVIGAVFERVALEPLVNPANAKFDGRTFSWLGSILNVTDVCMFWHTAPAKTIEEAKHTEVVVGSAGDGGNSVIAPRVLNTFLGTKLKIVPGYGGPELFLAMERGETHARCGMSWAGLKAARPDWVATGKVRVVMQMAMRKHHELQSVPNIMDLVTDPDERAALEFLYATQEMGRPFLAPPGVPAERVAALRRAFDDTMRDPIFLEDARKSNQEINAVPGTRVQEIVERLYKTPRAVIDKVEAIRRSK